MPAITPSYQELELFAVELAQHAGKILLDWRQKATIVTEKTNALDFATQADLASEQYIRAEILKRFPNHGVLGEEEGQSNATAEWMWVIDPLDGTLDYMRGLSSFSVHIALEHNNHVVVGCVVCPVTQDIFSASSGFGVRKNNCLVHVSDIASLDKSMIHFKSPGITDTLLDRSKSVAIFGSLVQVTGLIREGWEDGHSLANVASGFSEAFILAKHGPMWWDIAPGLVMIEEAGGMVTDLDGNPLKGRDTSHGIIASNGRIHKQLLEIVHI